MIYIINNIYNSSAHKLSDSSAKKNVFCINSPRLKCLWVTVAVVQKQNKHRYIVVRKNLESKTVSCRNFQAFCHCSDTLLLFFSNWHNVRTFFALSSGVFLRSHWDRRYLVSIARKWSLNLLIFAPKFVLSKIRSLWLHRLEAHGQSVRVWMTGRLTNDEQEKQQWAERAKISSNQPRGAAAFIQSCGWPRGGPAYFSTVTGTWQDGRSQVSREPQLQRRYIILYNK